MKNFLEATATQPELQISLTLTPVGKPNVVCRLSGVEIFRGILEATLTLKHAHALSQPVMLEIELKDKVYSLEYETAAIIESMFVDGIHVLPNYSHLAVYDNDHDHQSPTSYLGFNGCWRLDTGSSFYHWLHRVSGQGWLLEPTK